MSSEGKFALQMYSVVPYTSYMCGDSVLEAGHFDTISSFKHLKFRLGYRMKPILPDFHCILFNLAFDMISNLQIGSAENDINKIIYLL